MTLPQITPFLGRIFTSLSPIPYLFPPGPHSRSYICTQMYSVNTTSSSCRTIHTHTLPAPCAQNPPLSYHTYSARPLYRELHKHGVAMSAKSFAMGFRIEHPQSLIDTIQYGEQDASGQSIGSKQVSGIGGINNAASFRVHMTRIIKQCMILLILASKILN